MLRADLIRWSHASFAKYVLGESTLLGIPLLVEGLNERTNKFHEAPDRVELRINGPVSSLYSGCSRARWNVNLLVTSNLGQGAKNAFALNNLLGEFMATLSQDIPLFETGSVNDSGQQIGCLQQYGDVSAFHYGQLSVNDRVRQGVVTSAYRFDY